MHGDYSKSANFQMAARLSSNVGRKEVIIAIVKDEFAKDMKDAKRLAEHF